MILTNVHGVDTDVGSSEFGEARDRPTEDQSLLEIASTANAVMGGECLLDCEDIDDILLG